MQKFADESLRTALNPVADLMRVQRACHPASVFLEANQFIAVCLAVRWYDKKNWPKDLAEAIRNHDDVVYYIVPRPDASPYLGVRFGVEDHEYICF
jgi:hypothetical protein